MKREFKKGDSVLVRNTDLQQWVSAVFVEDDGEYFFADWGGYREAYNQCRHIDDFRTGDKVQVRNRATDEWEDAIYAVHLPHDSFEHLVFDEHMDDVNTYKLCRWYPSMPWAENKEQNQKLLTLEQRVEILERKLNDQ